MEYVDIIDTYDRVIGKASKDECHARGLLHRGSGLFVFSDTTFQYLLLQQRSIRVRNGGKWCSPGGHVSAGETSAYAAQREFYEELLGQEHPPAHIPYTFECLFSLVKDETEDRELITLYRVVVPGPFSPDPLEVSVAQFFDVKNIITDVGAHPEKYTVAFRCLFAKYCADILYAAHR